VLSWRRRRRGVHSGTVYEPDAARSAGGVTPINWNCIPSLSGLVRDPDWDTGQVTDPTPQFARDPATAAYYEQRAPEYDDWYLSAGLFAPRSRPGWTEEVAEVIELIEALPAARTLDIACGTGFLTRHLRGLVIGLDQSPAMVRIAQTRLPKGVAIVGDALNLPFADSAFDRVFTGHFYGHLPPGERARFLAEARRVARELVVVDAARRPDRRAEQWDDRQLSDGSRHRVYKRFLTAAQLAGEIDGAPLLDGRWFVLARARRPERAT
jgi:ubiquinone/menaquinone biosynthesis C-methylase UbiE